MTWRRAVVLRQRWAMVAPDCLRRGTWDVWDVDTLKERKREPHVSCILLLACTVWLWDGCRSAWSGVEGCFAGRSGGQRIRREVSQTQRSGGRSAKASVPQTVWGVRRGWRMQGLISTIDKALDAERASTRVTAARGRPRALFSWREGDGVAMITTMIRGRFGMALR